MCTASASVLVAVVPLLASLCTFSYVRVPNDTATAVTATANAQHGTLRLFLAATLKTRHPLCSVGILCWWRPKDARACCFFLHLIVMIHNCTRLVIQPEIKQTNDSPPPPPCWNRRQTISKVIFLLNAPPFFLVILSGYLKDLAGAFPYLQVHNLMNVYICKIVFNRGLTGVPRLFRMGLMGVSSVTWVTGQVVLFCFFTAAYNLGVLYIELRSFYSARICDLVCYWIFLF